MRLLFVIFFALSLPAAAYELLVVQTISATKRTFVTRNGKRQGVVEGLTASFVADDVALHARARTVTSQFTQWEIVSENAEVPFKPGQVVTYHPAEEYLWALNPEAARREMVQKVLHKPTGAILVKVASTRGLGESTSEAAPQSSSRGGIAFDFLFERKFHPHFAWDAGLRYEREVVNLAGASLTTQRALLLGDLLFYTDPFEAFHEARVFVAGGLGFGQSSSSVSGVTQSGSALLLPSAKLGTLLPFNRDWDFVAEVAFETLKTDEKQEAGGRQTTTQSNLRVGLGLRRQF